MLWFPYTSLLCVGCNLLARQAGISRGAYARPRMPIIYQSVNDYMPGKPW